MKGVVRGWGDKRGEGEYAGRRMESDKRQDGGESGTPSGAALSAGGGGGSRVRVADWAGPTPRRVLAGMTFNAWLIVINLLVFVAGVLMSSQPTMLRELTYGRDFEPWVTRQGAAAAMPEPGSEYLNPATGLLERRLLVPVMPLASMNAPIMVRGGVERFARMTLLDYWGHFSTAKVFFGLEVWRFVTFQFLHANVVHLLFNLIGLWFVGSLVEDYLGARRYAAFYLVCGIFGAIFYLLLNFVGNLAMGLQISAAQQVPFLLFDSVHTPLVGASAGIFGVLVAAAFIAPYERVWVLGVIPVPMRLAVGLFLGLALLNLTLGSANAGGEAAHVGGAIAGYFFVRRMHLLRDFFDVLGDSRKQRPPPGGGGGGSGGGGVGGGYVYPPSVSLPPTRVM